MGERQELGLIVTSSVSQPIFMNSISFLWTWFSYYNSRVHVHWWFLLFTKSFDFWGKWCLNLITNYCYGICARITDVRDELWCVLFKNWSQNITNTFMPAWKLFVLRMFRFLVPREGFGISGKKRLLLEVRRLCYPYNLACLFQHGVSNYCIIAYWATSWEYFFFKGRILSYYFVVLCSYHT